MPEFMASALRKGIASFDRKMRGYVTSDAIVVGVESRTSTPVRIPRDRESLQHPEVAGLYPTGEGAGFAGGIISAALDGERIAEAIAQQTENGKLKTEPTMRSESRGCLHTMPSREEEKPA